jgi:hypothetical protein
MSMEITKTFVVKTPVAAAWNFLTDPRRVASCLPGAAITEQRDDLSHAGTITVKVGPISATYRGTLRFERLDPVNHTAEIVATGQDVRGKGGADMIMTSRLVERAAGETEVTVASTVTVMGMLAQFGRGMIQDVSDQMFQKFVDAMRAQLEVPGEPEAAPSISSVEGPAPDAAASPVASVPPINLVALGSGAFARAVGRASRRPGVWIGAAALLALAIGYRVFRHRKEALAPAA